MLTLPSMLLDMTNTSAADSAMTRLRNHHGGLMSGCINVMTRHRCSASSTSTTKPAASTRATIIIRACKSAGEWTHAAIGGEFSALVRRARGCSMKSVPRLTWYADVELRIHGYQHEREVPHAVQRHQDGLPAVTHLVRQPQGTVL